MDANPKNHEILGYVERGKVSLALAAITFDVSIMEEFIPLAHGLTIYMANEDEIYNPSTSVQKHSPPHCLLNFAPSIPKFT